MSIPTLRPYQGDSLDAISVARERGLSRVLIKKPTGTGKTVTFAAMLTWPPLKAWLDTFHQSERRMLVIAHREELLDQAAAKIQAANPDLLVMVEQADRYASPYADVVVASIQTLSARNGKRLDRLMARMIFRIVIVDEAHHAAAKTYRAVLATLGFLPKSVSDDGVESFEAADFDDVAVMQEALVGWDARAAKDRLLVGVTATPNRTDAIGLGCVFQDIVYSYALRQAILDGWLVPIAPYVIETSTSLEDVKTTAGDFNQKQLAFTVNTPARNNLAVKGWQQYAKGRSTLAFTVDVQHAHDLAETFRVVGVSAEAVHGETPKEDRQRILRQYTEGQIQVITNCMILTEGTDLPRTSCILHAKPTKSATLYEQMTGRGLRLFEGKVDCLVLDVVDIARKHSLQVAPTLYGLPPGLIPKGQTLDTLADEWDELLEQMPGLAGGLDGRRLTIEQLKVQARSFDVWAIPDLGAFGQITDLKWMKTGDDVFQLRYPWNEDTEIVQVSRDLLGKWEVTCTLRPRDGLVRQRTLVHGLEEQTAAAGLAEAYVKQERPNVVRLKDKNAGWRSAPASPGQLSTIRQWNAKPWNRGKQIPLKPGMTKGEASDLLDIAFSKAKGRARQ